MITRLIVPGAPWKLLLATAALLVALPAAAKDYQVEAIVFQHTDSGTAEGTDEAWNFAPERLADRFQHMASLATKTAEHEFTPELENLLPIQESLAEAGYEILQTVNWRQPTSSYKEAPVMWLGNEFNELSAGFLRIYTTTLIYADLDLALSPRVLPAVGTVGTIDGLNADRDAVFYPPHYFISEKRRLKFKEVHYFDHPKFGAVVGVWPVDPEEPAPES